MEKDIDMKKRDLIFPGDFCMIATDKFADQGIKNGHRVYVVGHQAIPEDERDPYTQRIKFFIHLLEDKHVVAEKGLFVMDPRSLRKVNKGEQKKLADILAVDVAEVEIAEGATIN
jgi:hypothetical protein